MLKTRVIPVLLLKDGGLYKGVKFKKHKYVGDPINTVKIFNDKEVDELILLDITASKNKKGPNFELLNNIAAEAFMPLAYGGGVTNIEQAKLLFSIGFEKIVLNSAIKNNDVLITFIANHFGSQSVVVSLDIKKNLFGKYSCFVECGSVDIKKNPIDFAKHLEKLGVGEIIVNSIDRDGTSKGYDLDMIEKISSCVSVPVVALGGAGSITDFANAVKFGASSVAAGSMFVFNGPHNAVLITYPSYKELEENLKKGEI